MKLWMLNVFETIGQMLLHIGNSSLDYGHFPGDLKTSIIVPVQKLPNTS